VVESQVREVVEVLDLIYLMPIGYLILFIHCCEMTNLKYYDNEIFAFLQLV
jgi:hypothetical protein